MNNPTIQRVPNITSGKLSAGERPINGGSCIGQVAHEPQSAEVGTGAPEEEEEEDAFIFSAPSSSAAAAAAPSAGLQRPDL